MPDAGEVRPWDVLVLATLAPLGASRSVRLSPNLSPADLGVAASVPIPRGPGEFLVGVISDSTGPDSVPILLTTRRIIWFERIEPAPGAADRRPTLSGRAADYLDLGPEVVADGTTVDLGAGRVVPLPPNGRAPAEALATALRTLHRAATTGEAPAIDPELAGRIAGAIPKALALDARLADAGSQRARFREDLFADAPRVYATPAIVAACIGVWALMVASGVSADDPGPSERLAWGANNAVRVALKGETWRLPASVFLHGGLLHLAVNMYALFGMGPLVERLFGTLRFSTLYLAAGVGGALASTANGPARYSVGASGAIFGVLGAILAFLLVHRRSIPPTVLKPLRTQCLAFVVFNVAFGAAVPSIDQAAHLGGLATGFLAGVALAPPWPRRRASAAGAARSAFACAAVAAVVIAVCAGVLRWRAGTITPADLDVDFEVQLLPIEARQLETARGLADLEGEIKAAGGRSTRVDLASRLSNQERQGRAVLVELDSVWTPDPRLRAVADRLRDAQREQVAAIEAARRYVRSGDRRDLDGDEGFLRHQGAMARLRRSGLRLMQDYRRDGGLIAPSGPP